MLKCHLNFIVIATDKLIVSFHQFQYKTINILSRLSKPLVRTNSSQDTDMIMDVT